jgi:hypothetical protein
MTCCAVTSRRRIEDLLREEFADERRQGVADRGDANL